MSNVKSSQSDKPTIQDGYVSDPKLPAKFSVNSDYFREWLAEHDKFKYIPSQSKAKTFTCYKDSKGYWSAQKRVMGKLRAKRLGDSSQLSRFTVTAFWDVAVFLTSEYQTKDGEIETLQKENKELSLRIAELNDKIAELENNQEQDRQSLTKYNKPEEADRELIKLLEEALKVPANNATKAKPRLVQAIAILTGEMTEEVEKRLDVRYNRKRTGQ